MKFLIQTTSINGHIIPATEDAYQVIEDMKYKEWHDGTPLTETIIIHSDRMDYGRDVCPVGAVEFVHSYMLENEIPIPPAVDVQVHFPTLTPTRYYSNPNIDKEYFIKDAINVKGLEPTITKEVDWPRVSSGKLLCLDVVDYLSEYRIFILNSDIIGLKHYIGDIYAFPPATFVKQLAESLPNFTGTIDIGQTLDNWNVIEIHNAYSCGLYGQKHKVARWLWTWWFRYCSKVN